MEAESQIHSSAPERVDEPMLGFTHKAYVNAPPERVFDAIAAAAGLNAWFTTGATVAQEVGGTIQFRWVDWGPDRVTLEDGGPILVRDRPKRFVFQWGKEIRTTVSLDFQARDSGTVVEVRETGFPRTRAGLASLSENATGWGEALTLLKFFVERGLVYEG